MIKPSWHSSGEEAVINDTFLSYTFAIISIPPTSCSHYETLLALFISTGSIIQDIPCTRGNTSSSVFVLAHDAFLVCGPVSGVQATTRNAPRRGTCIIRDAGGSFLLAI